MKQEHRSGIGTKMYFVREHLYYDKSIRVAPFLEYCVCEGKIQKYIRTNYTEMCLLCNSPFFCGSLNYFKLSAIGEAVFYTPQEAALLAKTMTEKYERIWGWTGDSHLRRTWIHLLEGSLKQQESIA